ncbi:MAG: hypothetical protein EP349_05170 [Alphaproteobacteria bacterium]|nr:MAG: hypothetical protein EP349_05170 [Alphaproteobacteria bacterium]
MRSDIAQEVRAFLDIFLREARPAQRRGKTCPAVSMQSLQGGFYYLYAADSPVRNMAERFGMPEITGQYRYPGDLVFGEMQNYMVLLNEGKRRGMLTLPQYAERIDRLWDALKELNPVLNRVQIRHDTARKGEFGEDWATKQKRAAIIGVDDGYNVTDIGFFLDRFQGCGDAFNMSGRKIKEAEDYAALSANVQSYVGLIAWRPAPQTLNYIHQIALGFSPADAPMHAGWVPENRHREQPRDPYEHMHPFYRPKF